MTTFDVRAAKALPPGKHMLVPNCPGLRLAATATRKTWTYRYEDAQGKMKQQKLGTWPGLDFAAAVSEWTRLRNQREKGVDPVRQKKVEKAAALVAPATTVRALAATFLDRYIDKERSKDSASAARSALERMLDEEPEFAAIRPNEVGRGLAFQVIDKRRDKPTAAARLRALLGQAWDYGLDAGLIDPDTPNYWRLVLHGKLKSKGKLIGGEHQGKVFRALSDDELRTLLPWCLEHMHVNGRDGAFLYLWTGMRGVELFGLRPEFIRKEKDGWWLTYPLGLLKTADQADTVDHRVPLVGRALEIVQRRIKKVGDTGYLFETMKGGEVQQYTQSAFSSYAYHLQPYSAKVKRRASEGLVSPVSGWSPHDLRRTARTMLTKLRCDVQVAEAFIGHKPPGIVSVYDRHTFDAEKREVAEQLAAAMEKLLQEGLPARP